MNKKILLLVIIVAVLVVLPFLSQQRKIPDSGYPWQIELHQDGLSTVFGLTLGRTTMTEARNILGEGMKLALLSTDTGDAGIEMYYGNYTAGRLSGRLIIVADLATDQLAGIRRRATRAGGANSFRIHVDDFPVVMQAAIKTITFIPIVDLDKEVVMQRFGQPEEIIVGKDKLTHFLYPDKGLDIILDDDGKEVLQYVAPNRFNQLRAPLNN